MDTPISMFWNAFVDVYNTITNKEMMKRFWHLNPHVYKNETNIITGEKSLDDNCLYEPGSIRDSIREWF